jgi:transcriptional regulator with PAS, ATPase and Fis domain
VNTRVVAATNQSLFGMVEAGRFRTDLYYRLAGVEVVVPPLRARRDDIPLLVDHFLSVHQHGAQMTVADSALEALLTYEWPGNVRQLERVIERAIALSAGSEITLADLPEEVGREYAALVVLDRNDSLRAWSSRYARLVLERSGGNKRQACDILDISYHTLRTLLAYNPAVRLARNSDTRKPERTPESAAEVGQPIR